MPHIANYVTLLRAKSKASGLHLYVADSHDLLHVLRLLQEIISQKEDRVRFNETSNKDGLNAEHRCYNLLRSKCSFLETEMEMLVFTGIHFS